MKNIIRNVTLAYSCLISSLVYGQTELPVIAEEIPLALSSHQSESTVMEIQHHGAEFIKIHFKNLILPKGSLIRLMSNDGSEMVEYTESQQEWFAQSLFGDSVKIELVPNAEGQLGQYEIDYFMAGNEKARAFEPSSTVLSTCGVNERKDVACWQDTHPEQVAWSNPVARLLINGRSLCTAWRVGPDNKLFTNNHCVGSESELRNTEVWFNYQRNTCGGALSTTVKVMGNELFSTDYTLDYTLFSVDDFSKIESFGYLGLDASEPVYGNGIYIPQHGAGNPKELAIESDQNGSGLCQIDIASTNGRGAGTDTGYLCDTIGGSSGSPVLNSSDNKAIALHHFGGCENQGVKISKIWPKVATFFNNTLPEGSVGRSVPSVEELIPGTPISAIALSKGEQRMLVVKAQNRTSPLTISISSGTGDADLYVRSGSEPTTGVYDCRPYRSGNNETCSVSSADEDLYIMLKAFNSFSGVVLRATEN
ncbi:serine protease [Vibrio salilacus]|uniref:serine protease n=1 Tax=Vibrio salilacus TaxID=1323749 RepID=UPI000C298EA5|nr:serine protease [Vibrio salilacus]